MSKTIQRRKLAAKKQGFGDTKSSRYISIPGIQIPRRHRQYFGNSLDVFNADIWAREALINLQANMRLGNLVSRDFDNIVAQHGDVVNVVRPGTFNAQRKAPGENVNVSPATASKIQVPLDQYLYVTFQINDGDENRSMVDLIQTFLLPAVQALAQMVDLCLSGQQAQFWNTCIGGHLGGLSGTTMHDYVLEVKENMDKLRVPTNGRWMTLTPTAESAGLKVDMFTKVNESGQTEALYQGILGERFGFNFAQCHNQPYVLPGQTLASTTTTALAAADATVVNLTAVTNMAVGNWIVLGGDDTPQQITAINTLAVTIAPGLRRAISSGASAVVIRGGLVNQPSAILDNHGTSYTNGYFGAGTSPRTVGYAKDIICDGFQAGSPPQVGQVVTFGNAGGANNAIKYTIVYVLATGVSNEYAIRLDRPLQVAIADNDTVNLGPAGQYNFAFLPRSVALVNRPLPKPRTGSLSSVIVYNNLSIRVTISYDGKAQAHIVTLDFLMGVSPLDQNLGAVMFG